MQVRGVMEMEIPVTSSMTFRVRRTTRLRGERSHVRGIGYRVEKLKSTYSSLCGPGEKVYRFAGVGAGFRANLGRPVRCDRE